MPKPIVVRGEFEAVRVDDIPSSNLDIAKAVDKYLSRLLRDIDKLVECKIGYFEENKLDLDTNINYIDILPMFQNIYGRFASIDLKFRTKLIESLRREIPYIKELIHLYHKTYDGKKQKIIHCKKFVMYLEKRVKHIQYDLENPEFKIALENRFKFELGKRVFAHKKSLHYILNVKCYYFDKLIWVSANKSNKIRGTFLSLKDCDKLCLKYYLGYYLENVNVKTMKAPLLKEYIEEVYNKL
jgi:hypothetical protein